MTGETTTAGATWFETRGFAAPLTTRANGGHLLQASRPHPEEAAKPPSRSTKAGRALVGGEAKL
jgi:hypothetical protein